MNRNWEGVFAACTTQFCTDQSLDIPAALHYHPKLVQYIKLAMQECGLGTETTRAPRLPLIGV